MSNRRYRVSIGENLDRDVRRAAVADISLGEAFRRAIALFILAADAERVTLVTHRPDGLHEQNVIV